MEHKYKFSIILKLSCVIRSKSYYEKDMRMPSDMNSFGIGTFSFQKLSEDIV